MLNFYICLSFLSFDLGKKSFGRAAADVLSIAVDFAESISTLPGEVI